MGELSRSRGRTRWLVGELQVVSKVLLELRDDALTDSEKDSSLLSASERLVELLEPMLAHVPSTISVLACSIVLWYSKIRTPHSSSLS